MRPRAFQPLIEPGQRGPQIVGHVAAYLAQALHQDADAVQHVIERTGEAIQIVPCASRRHAAREIAVDDRFCGPRNRVDAPQKGSTQRYAANDAEHRRKADGPEKSSGDGFLEIINLLQIATDREQYAVSEIGNQGADPLGSAAILGSLRHLDAGPTGREPRRRRHFAREMSPRPVLNKVVERACALPTLPHYVDEMSQALGLKLYS